jgi:hypothetical protein
MAATGVHLVIHNIEMMMRMIEVSTVEGRERGVTANGEEERVNGDYGYNNQTISYHCVIQMPTPTATTHNILCVTHTDSNDM